MDQLAIACIALLSGCFIVPKATTTEKIVARGTSSEQSRPAGFELDAQGFEINVSTSAPQNCVRQRYVDLDVTRRKEAVLAAPGLDDIGNGGQYGVLILLMGSIATLPISGIVTGIVVATSEDTTVRERRYVASKRVRCPVHAANVPVTFTWPSGAIVQLVTDPRGVATGHVPAAEVDTGVVTVRVADLPTKWIAYSSSSGRDQRWGHRLAEHR